MASTVEAGGARMETGQVTVQIPDVGAPRRLTPPKVAESKLRSGMRVLAVRKATVPRVELRLLIPYSSTNLAAARILAKTLTSGTSARTSRQIAQDLQRMGASVQAGVGVDHFQIIGSTLSAHLNEYLDLLAELLTDAEFPADEVALERTRTAQEIHISRSQPQTLAQEALRRRLFGRHRYGTVLPEPEQVARVGRAVVRRAHREALGPRGSVFVLVGDVQPASVIELVDEKLKRWRTRTVAPKVASPAPPKLGPTLIVDRPGSVQTNILIAGSVPAIGDDDSYAIDLANTIFGGYFISRLTENLREDKGYTYSPYSAMAHYQHANYLQIGADVGAEVTAPALVETHYELGRMIALPVEPDELESAKRYRVGIQALRIQSQAGLAGVLAGLVIHGLDIGYLREYPKRMTALTAADVRDASVKYLAPSRLITVLVGDRARIESDVGALEAVEASS
jgi:zinc protease